MNTGTTDRQRRADAILLIKYVKYQAQRKASTLPDDELISICRNSEYGDKNANLLTKSIIQYINYTGGFAHRQQSQGQYNAKLGRWTKGTTAKGISDINGLLNAVPLSIEVKYGRDRMSEAQHKVKNQIQAAGGHYYEAKNLPDAIDWINATAGIAPGTIAKLLQEAKELFNNKVQKKCA